MLHRIAEMIVSHFEERGIINASEQEREVYIYGFDIAIYGVTSTLSVILVGLLFSRLPETLLLLTVFYTNQTLGGGFHANSHLSCFLTMLAGQMLFFAFLLISIPVGICTVILLLSLTILYWYPVVLHKNKRYLMSKMPYFIRRSRIAIIIEMLFSLLVLFFGSQRLIQALCLSLLLSAVSRMSAVIRR